MGCGISKLDIEDTGLGYRIKSLRGRENDADSHRKSVSSVTSEGGFLRRVISSNEKRRGVERELEPDPGPKSNFFSSSWTINMYVSNALSFKQLPLETMEKDVPNPDHNKEQAGKPVDDVEDELIRPSNVEEEYASILLSPGSPSFRVYCVDNDSVTSHHTDEKSKSTKESDKGSETPQRGRKGRGFRSGYKGGGASNRGLKMVLHRGGSVGVRNLWNISSRYQNPTPSNCSTSKPV